MYNELLGTEVAGDSSQQALLVRYDLNKLNVKKPVKGKLEIAMEQYNEDITKLWLSVNNVFLAQLAEARKHSVSDNDWSTLEV